MVSLKTHNLLDYVLGAALLAAPWIFGFASITKASSVFLFFGAVLILYSLLTNYHYSAMRIIPLGLPMTLDALMGVILILAPVIFGYRVFLSESQYASHVVLGLCAIGLVALTRPRTEAAKTPAERASIDGDSKSDRSLGRALPHSSPH